MVHSSNFMWSCGAGSERIPCWFYLGSAHFRFLVTFSWFSKTPNPDGNRLPGYPKITWLLIIWAVFKTLVGWWLYGIVLRNTGIPTNQPGLNGMTEKFWTLLIFCPFKKSQVLGPRPGTVQGLKTGSEALATATEGWIPQVLHFVGVWYTNRRCFDKAFWGFKYPLAMTNIAIENGHRNSWFTH